MKTIAEFMVRVVDLVEAEGRTFLSLARREADHVRSAVRQDAMELRTAARQEAEHLRAAVRRLIAGLVALLCAVPLLYGGIGLMAYGAFDWLTGLIGRAGAGALVGVVLVALGGVCVWTAKRITAAKQ